VNFVSVRSGRLKIIAAAVLGPSLNNIAIRLPSSIGLLTAIVIGFAMTAFLRVNICNAWHVPI